MEICLLKFFSMISSSQSKYCKLFEPHTTFAALCRPSFITLYMVFMSACIASMFTLLSISCWSSFIFAASRSFQVLRRGSGAILLVFLHPSVKSHRSNLCCVKHSSLGITLALLMSLKCFFGYIMKSICDWVPPDL